MVGTFDECFPTMSIRGKRKRARRPCTPHQPLAPGMQSTLTQCANADHISLSLYGRAYDLHLPQCPSTRKPVSGLVTYFKHGWFQRPVSICSVRRRPEDAPAACNLHIGGVDVRAVAEACRPGDIIWHATASSSEQCAGCVTCSACTVRQHHATALPKLPSVPMCVADRLDQPCWQLPLQLYGLQIGLWLHAANDIVPAAVSPARQVPPYVLSYMRDRVRNTC